MSRSANLPTVADVVIVGGGTSGAVLARRLADDPERSVILLEAGPSDEGHLGVLTLRDWLELFDSEVSVPYPVELQPQANSDLLHSRGRILGGCSSHNACIALRAPDQDLERWRSSGADGWGPAETAGAWGRVLAAVAVSASTTPNPLAAAAVEAGRQLGLPLIDAWGPAVPRGIGWLPLNVRDGVRQSSSVAYLHPLAGVPANLTILTGMPAKCVEIDPHGRAVAVCTEVGPILANREVVLCAGAFETPKLLMLSGVGPARQLRDHGISPLVDLPGVGEHLIDHPESLITWEAARPVPDEADSLWEVGLFAETSAGLTMAHVGMKPVVLADGVPPAHGLSITPNVPYARSQGSVRLRSADPAIKPLADPCLGRPAATSRFEVAAREVADALAPKDDSRASAALRRRLAITLLTRALARATDRAAA